MGVLGGNAYFGVAMMLAQSNRLITSVALAHAAGILLHLICFHIPLGRAGDAALLGLGIIAFSLVALFGWPSLQVPREGAAVDRMGNPIYPRKILDLQGAVAPPNLQEPRGFAIQLVALTTLLAVLFNVLNSVTSLGTPGYQYAEVWPRLVVAVCGVAAGVFFDIDRRRHMGTVVLCVAFLAMAAALAAGSGLNITVCRVAFYAESGIFAVFYLSLFIWLAAYMRVPQLWAGMGKVISNVVALVVTIPSAVLAQANDQALTSLAFVLFAAVLILMTRAGMLTPDYEERISSYSEKSTDAEETPDHESAEKPDQESPEQASPRSPEEALAAFCESYGLTKRESDVLAAVVSDERPLKHVAAELGVGLRTVQHHLTSLYKKTGTQTRTGLTARFIEESQNGAQARESHEEQPSEATRGASAEGASGE